MLRALSLAALSRAAAASPWAAVDAVLARGVSERVFPCAAAAVVDAAGRVVYSRAVGRLAYGDAPAPPRDNGTNPAADFRGTLFDMASLTKILGPTTAAALLFQSGDLALDELVSSPKLLGPAFAAAGKGAVTVRHLLLHAAGFPPDPVPNFNDASFGCPNSAAAHPALDFSCADMILAAVNAQPLVNIPGAVYLYSDLSMITLALALGRFFATQRPQWVSAAAAGPACAAALVANPASLGVRYTCAFTSFWRVNVSAAVGLAPTSGYLPPDAAATAPTWLDTVYRHEQLQGVVSDENSYALGGIAGHAGIFASGADAARFLAAWGPGSTLLNASTIALFTTRANEPAGSARALGWSTEADSYAGCAPMAADTAYHTGYTGTQLCLGKNYSTVLLAARVYPNKTGNVDAIHALRQEFNAAVAAAWGERPAFAYPWQDPSLPLAERAANIISLLTLEEKAAQLEAGAPAVPRIALPAYSYARECERGDSSGRRGTAFPSGAGLAASWDADLIFRVARATALEARANANTGDGAPSCFGPVVNFVHDATWGRTNEMLTGEDTTLGGTLGAAFVAGLQSWREATPAGERLAVASTVKHLNAYSGPEGHGYTFGPFAERFSFNAHMSQRAWREFFVPAFRATAREGARAFMCSYTAVTTDDGFLDNTPACASTQLLTRVLRDEFKWNGYVVSDAGGVVFSGNTSIGGVPFGHHATGDASATAVASLTAGCDVELTCCGAPAVFSTLPASVGAGAVPEAALDTALARALRSRLELGVLDPPGSHEWDAWGSANVSTPEMVAQAAEAAAAGVVLLKNDKAPGAAAPMLPLSHAALAGASIAVIGPLANDSWAVMGGYVNQHPSFIRTIFDGLVDALPLSNVLLDAACADSACPAFNASAVALAARADVAVVVAVLGTTGYYNKGSNNESAACGCPAGNAIEGECCDRTDTHLPGAQLELLQALAALGKPMLLVLNSGGYVDAAWPAASAGVAAIVHAPFLGMAAGDGVARVVTGAVNPSAKTTLTWYEDAARDLAPLRNYSDDALYNKTYRYTSARVTYAFGHGLSFSTFSFADLVIVPAAPRGCDTLNVSVTLANDSDFDGAEVVQVYGTLRNATVRAPLKQLLAFRKVLVPARRSVKVTLAVPPAARSVLRGGDYTRAVEPGALAVRVAASSDARAPGGAGVSSVVVGVGPAVLVDACE